VADARLGLIQGRVPDGPAWEGLVARNGDKAPSLFFDLPGPTREHVGAERATHLLDALELADFGLWTANAQGTGNDPAAEQAGAQA
jgi:hypothetical protein